MNTTVLTLGSVTYAIKGRKLLMRAGINSKLVKVSGGTVGAGCNHGLEISSDDFYSAVSVLRAAGVAYSVVPGQ